jgi:hypothetical protein
MQNTFSFHDPRVTEQRVTAQWSYIVSDPNFCNHHWFGCAYSHLLQECMAATSGGPRRIIARKEDDTQLWFEEVLQL